MNRNATTNIRINPKKWNRNANLRDFLNTLGEERNINTDKILEIDKKESRSNNSEHDNCECQKQGHTA